MEKVNVVFVTSHLYLFWTIGVYYLWELCKNKNYRIILVVDESYRQAPRFIEICTFLNVVDIFYIPSEKVPFWEHITYSRYLKKIVSKFKPKIILQHNYTYFKNIYMFHWANMITPECHKIVYLNAQMPLIDSDIFFADQREKQIKYLSKKYRLPGILFRLGIVGREYILNFFNYNILPRLVTLEFSNRFPFSMIMRKDSTKPIFDFFLTYHDFENNHIKSRFKSTEPFKQIRCPLETYGAECNQHLYSLKEENIVLILPSVIGFRTFEEEDDDLNEWIAAIEVLADKFQGYQLCLKFHPGTRSNPSFNQIKSHVEKKFREINILDTGECAEQWILKSKVVVGDFSTTLWWADFIKGKIVISLDLHQFPGSENMKYHADVYCFDGLDELRNFDFNYAMTKQNIEKTSGRENLPTLTEFLNSLIFP